MKKYIKNVTGQKEGDFPYPQELSYKEGKELIKLKSGESRETKLTNPVGSNLNEPRLIVIGEEESMKKYKKKKVEVD